MCSLTLWRLTTLYGSYRTANLQTLHFIYLFNKCRYWIFETRSILSVFFSSKCSLFHNANMFGSCIIHIWYTGCAEIKKNNFGAKGLRKRAILSTDFGKICTKCHENPSSGNGGFLRGQTDRQTDMTKPTVAFPQFSQTIPESHFVAPAGFPYFILSQNCRRGKFSEMVQLVTAYRLRRRESSPSSSWLWYEYMRCRTRLVPKKCVVCSQLGC